MRRPIPFRPSLFFRSLLGKRAAPNANIVAPVRDVDDVHNTTPETDDELHQCWNRVRAHLQTDAAWSTTRLGLYFRTLCVPPALYLAGLARMHEHFDVSSMRALHPEKEPDLAAAMDFATRAGEAALLLYRRNPGALDPDELRGQEQAQTHFMACVVDLANRGMHHTSMDDLRFLALTATVRHGASAPGRDWELLLAEEIRWCLAAHPIVQAALMQKYPGTAPYLREFALLCELVPPLDAMHRVWYPRLEQDCLVYALPDGATL